MNRDRVEQMVDKMDGQRAVGWRFDLIVRSAHNGAMLGKVEGGL